MREIYQWTKWFEELAREIAKGGPQSLTKCAGNVKNEVPLLPYYNDTNIDPFSFVFSIASKIRTPDSREHLYRSVERVFNMTQELPVEFDGPFILPEQAPWNLPDPSNDVGELPLLWRLFSAAVSEAESADDQIFDEALNTIQDVTIKELTQALFLINPSAFLPYDDATRSLGISDLPGDITWKRYRDELPKFGGAFPGCAFCEVNLFAYLWKNGDLPIRRRYFQVSTNAYGAREGDFWNGSDPELDFEPNHWVFTGGPGEEGKKYPLPAPQRGDVMLVRTGVRKGRGIGIVYKNDHQNHDHFDENNRIHVVWVNRQDEEIPISAQMLPAFTRAMKITDAFRQAPAYKTTFALLDRLGHREGPMADQGTLQDPDVKHPLNQILYGPPGTGKTYHTVARALAIIDRANVRERGEGDLKRFHKLRASGHIEMVTFHQSYAYEDFIEGIRPVLDDGAGGLRYELRDGIFKRMAELAIAERDERFILIIDEINRGNIAKIFGELITLIEDSRRLGASDATEVTLPYWDKSFGVPDNLYLIGTMNTADRSIQLLDTALRRRFVFVEMMPEPEHKDICENAGGVNCRQMLKVMNACITALLDREHQIGHTYLMGVDTMEKLSDVFRNRIFPLLQEYFFDDWSKIRAVLGGNDFVSERDASRLPVDLEQGEDRKIYERLPSNHGRWEDPEQYRQIYASDN